MRDGCAASIVANVLSSVVPKKRRNFTAVKKVVCSSEGIGGSFPPGTAADTALSQRIA